MASGITPLTLPTLLTLAACSAWLHGVHAYSMLDVMAHGAVQSIKSNAGEHASMLTDLLEINENRVLVPKSRQKRIIELPKGLVFELKWNIDVPFQTFTRFGTFWQFALLIDALYPAEFLHDTVANPLSEIIPPDLAQIVGDTFTDGREEEAVGNRVRRAAGADSAAQGEVDALQREKRASQTEREEVYSFVENLLQWSGLPPRACLLRTICEVAEAPFKQELLGDLINTIFRPSRGASSTTGSEYDEFLKAEKHGYHHGLCHLKFKECPETIFDRMPFFKNNLF